jgi:hypothetical protein
MARKTFTISRAHVETASADSLRAEIVTETGSESEAASILRSLERMGTDPSIEFFEFIPVSSRLAYGGAHSNAWRVRADRGQTEEPML